MMLLGKEQLIQLTTNNNRTHALPGLCALVYSKSAFYVSFFTQNIKNMCAQGSIFDTINIFPHFIKDILQQKLFWSYLFLNVVICLFTVY